MFPLSLGSFGANRLVHLMANRIQLATLLPVGAAIAVSYTHLTLPTNREV